MRTAPTSLKVYQIIRQYEDKSLLPRPYFQRRFVWTARDKHNFVDTIIKGYPFPEIYLADGEVNVDTGSGQQLLVDGQQRVTAIIEYFRGTLRNVKDSPIVPYAKLGKDIKEFFLQYDVAVRSLGLIKESEIVEVFQRINMTNYALNDMEVNNAIYSGEFKKLAEKIADHEFFDRHNTFRPMQKRRMGDVKYVAILLATMMGGYFNRDDHLEEYLSRYDEEFDLKEEIEKRIERAFNFVESLGLPERERAWKQTDLFTLLVEVDRAQFIEGNSINSQDAGKVLKEFYGIVDHQNYDFGDDASSRKLVNDYYSATQQAVNDRLNRVKRADPIRAILESASAKSATVE